MITDVDEQWMRHAITLATTVRDWWDHAPFGCYIVDENGLKISIGYGSQTVTDPTCHSEVIAIRDACGHRGRYLQGCTLYSTHEPCPMCCGAIRHSNVSRVVWGSTREDLPHLFRRHRYEAVDLLRDSGNPPEMVSGVLRHECVELLAGWVDLT